MATAIAVGATRAGHRALVRSTFDLAADFAQAEATGSRHDFVQQLTRVDLLVLDDFGMKKLRPSAAEDLLEILVRRHETGSILITTNRPTQDWGVFLGNVPAATAILDPRHQEDRGRCRRRGRGEHAPTAPWKSLRDFHKRPPPILAICTERTRRPRLRAAADHAILTATAAGRFSNVPRWAHLNVR